MIRTGCVTAGGLGLLPWAPGTWGSLPPVAVAVVLAFAAPAATTLSQLALMLVASIMCLALTSFAATRFGRQDPGEMVLDEVAGMALALVVLPWTWMATQPWVASAVAVAVFVAFRIFDIAKPGPINRSQDLPGPWGVLVDDLLAGVLAGAIGWGVVWVLTAASVIHLSGGEVALP